MIQAFVTGNLGRDAETRAAGDDMVTSFSVASSRKVKGESVTQWVDCSIFGKRGIALKEYLTKGTRVAVCGELSLREHEGKTYVKVRVDQLDLMGGGNKRDDETREQKPASKPDDDPLPF